jgi:hypothetical protein
MLRMAIIKILEWGCNEYIDQWALNELLKEVFDGKHCPFITYLDTGDDPEVEAFAVASQEITQDEAQQAWKDFWKEREARVTERELIVLAALFAYANRWATFEHPRIVVEWLPTRDDVQRLINANHTVTIGDALLAINGKPYGADLTFANGKLFEHHLAEAELWLQDLKDGHACHRITRGYPKVAALMW